MNIGHKQAVHNKLDVHDGNDVPIDQAGGEGERNRLFLTPSSSPVSALALARPRLRVTQL